MTNPFENKTPTELIAMVRGETILCRECAGNGGPVKHPCPTCNGSGKQPPLSDTDLDALAACYCDGCIIDLGKIRRCRIKDNPYAPWLNIFAYTTDWREAGRLFQKYRLQMGQLGGDDEWWIARNLLGIGESSESSLAQDDNPCCAIIKAVVIVELEASILKKEQSNEP